MKINTLSIFLILGIIALADVRMASASPTISIVPASITGLNQGDTFSVDVTVDPEGQPVRVVEISLKFDPAVVQVDGSNSISCNIGIRKCSSDPGDFWGYNRPLELLNVINNTNGTLHLAHVVGRSRTPEITTPGTYATLYFKINSNAPAGRSTLDLTTAKLASGNGYLPIVIANNGTITIVNTSSSAVVTTPALKTPGFSVPMALIAMIGLILCNLRRKNR
jgi:hypothetical protein